MSERKRASLERLSELAQRYEARALVSARGGGLESMGPKPPPQAPLEARLKQRARSEKELSTAMESLERVRDGKELDNDQVIALEAIVRPTFRPVIDISNDSFHEAPSPWEDLLQDAARQRLETVIRAVGRVEVPGHPSIPYGGTGFIVGESLVMTNRHVAEIFTAGVGARNVTFRRGLGSELDFKQEVRSSASERMRVSRVVMIHPFWDCALLEIPGVGAQRPVMQLRATPPDQIRDTRIAVIGYPAFDPRSDIDLQRRIFGGVFNCKRLQPGMLMETREIQSYDDRVIAVTHDASTLGGNSGSIVAEVESGHVMGLHFAGVYLDANYAVPAWELARDPRIIDAGVTFATPPARQATAPWEHRWLETEGRG
jgi:V8-like Glu-specific endopeptidase